MKYFDPLRPKLNSEPCYVDGSARRIAPLPRLYLSPAEDPAPLGAWLISLMLKHSDGSYYWHETVFDSPESRERFLTAFLENPEEVLEYYFGYEGPTEAKPKPKPQFEFDPEALGL